MAKAPEPVDSSAEPVRPVSNGSNSDRHHAKAGEKRGNKNKQRPVANEITGVKQLSDELPDSLDDGRSLSPDTLLPRRSVSNVYDILPPSALSLAISTIEKKVRNLEKRKAKLDLYKSEANLGNLVLNEDQQSAVDRYDGVVHSLEFAQELLAHLRTLVLDEEKTRRRLAKKIEADMLKDETVRLMTIMQAQILLDRASGDDGSIKSNLAFATKKLPDSSTPSRSSGRVSGRSRASRQAVEVQGLTDDEVATLQSFATLLSGFQSVKAVHVVDKNDKKAVGTLKQMADAWTSFLDQTASQKQDEPAKDKEPAVDFKVLSDLIFKRLPPVLDVVAAEEKKPTLSATLSSNTANTTAPPSRQLASTQTSPGHPEGRVGKQPSQQQSQIAVKRSESDAPTSQTLPRTRKSGQARVKAAAVSTSSGSTSSSNVAVVGPDGSVNGQALRTDDQAARTAIDQPTVHTEPIGGDKSELVATAPSDRLPVTSPSQFEDMKTEFVSSHHSSIIPTPRSPENGGLIGQPVSSLPAPNESTGYQFQPTVNNVPGHSVQQVQKQGHIQAQSHQMHHPQHNQAVSHPVPSSYYIHSPSVNESGVPVTAVGHFVADPSSFNFFQESVINQNGPTAGPVAQVRSMPPAAVVQQQQQQPRRHVPDYHPHVQHGQSTAESPIQLLDPAVVMMIHGDSSTTNGGGGSGHATTQSSSHVTMGHQQSFQIPLDTLSPGSRAAVNLPPVQAAQRVTKPDDAGNSSPANLPVVNAGQSRSEVQPDRTVGGSKADSIPAGYPTTFTASKPSTHSSVSEAKPSVAAQTNDDANRRPVERSAYNSSVESGNANRVTSGHNYQNRTNSSANSRHERQYNDNRGGRSRGYGPRSNQRGGGYQYQKGAFNQRFSGHHNRHDGVNNSYTHQQRAGGNRSGQGVATGDARTGDQF